MRLWLQIRLALLLRALLFALGSRFAGPFRLRRAFHTCRKEWIRLHEVMTAIFIALLLFAVVPASSQLAVTVAPPKTVVQKVIVPLTLKNTFAKQVESVRATVFLLDEQGKVLGQATQWFIGRTKDRPALCRNLVNR